MSIPLLELRNITKVFRIGGGLGLFSTRTIKAVDSVSFTMPADKPVIVALVGESGSGKTTIARMILGLLKPTSGDILYRGRSVSQWLKENRLEYYKEVQPIFQDPYSIYNPFYRIDRVLKMTIRKFKLASSEQEAEKMIVEAMREVGLRPEDLLGRYPHQLSGGERQRFMLVRILLIKPRLIVADEPVSMIDVSLRAIFLDHLLSLRDKLGTSCLYITHDLNTASYVADSIIVLCHGRVVEDGSANEVISDPLHPYTKLLLTSLPVPDPRQRWGEEIDLSTLETFEKIKAEKGCVFHARCPYATDECRERAPPLIEAKPGRRVACFLYTS